MKYQNTQRRCNIYMKLFLVRIKQKNEFIYSTKMKVKDLKNFTEFSFRFPYIESLADEKNAKRFDQYINKFVKFGINLKYNENSIQRKPNIDRIFSIRDYIEETNNFIPNSIILACYKQYKDDEIDEYDNIIRPLDINNDLFYIELDENYKMIVIDGQHRLAGFFLSKNKEVEEMEVPITILFGPSLSTCSKLFVDINGNQKAVDNSLIYDLTDFLEDRFNSNKLKEKEIESIKICHNICKALYSDIKSPLYGQIRMLSTGYGSVSQAFLVEYLYPIINNGVLKEYSFQQQFESIYYLLKSLQTTFKYDWPVLDGEQNLEKIKDHADYVLNKKKSQLAKTLGLGAFFLVFPHLFKTCQFDYTKYLKQISKLEDRFIWSKMEYEEAFIDDYFSSRKLPIYREGTNKAAIKDLAVQILKVIEKE